MAGAFEAILLTPEGWISDGITSNVYLVKGKTIFTPSREACSLEGITRGIVLELAGRMGLEVVEGLLPRRDIETADELFLTSTTREIVPIVRVKDAAGAMVITKSKPGPVARALREFYVRELDVLIQED